ncbi:unnamed protein product [Boreogadus saida]
MDPPQRSAAVGTDKELSDLLDFSAMFSPPVGGGRNRRTSLGSSRFTAAGMDEGSGPAWTPRGPASPENQPPRGPASPENQPPRGLTTGGPHYGDLLSDSRLAPLQGPHATPAVTSSRTGKAERAVGQGYGRAPVGPGCQSSLRSSVGTRPTGVKSPAPFPSFTAANQRRRSLPEPIEPLQTKKVRKVPPGLPSSVSGRSSASHINRLPPPPSSHSRSTDTQTHRHTSTQTR